MLGTVDAMTWTLPTDTLWDGKANTLGAQVDALLKRLRKWCNEHSHLISRADVLVKAPDEFVFVAMQTDVPYDFDLADALTDLDLEVANSDDYDLIEFDVGGIPLCPGASERAFYDRNNVICIVNFIDNA